MRLIPRGAAKAVLFFSVLPALFSADDPAVFRARTELNHVQELVLAGVLPPMRLQQAKDVLADAEDGARIRTSLYERDLTVAQAEQLVEIAARRVERNQHAFDERKKLVESGILARSEMDDLSAALERSRSEHQWALKRVGFAQDLEVLARSEQEAMRQLELAGAAQARSRGGMVEHFLGSAIFSIADLSTISKAFEKKFTHEMPISALGETEVHKALGFDHRNRVDIAIAPDTQEGQWLREYLMTRKIPFYAFRTALPGRATGAHIHIGPPSTRFVAGKSGAPMNRAGS